MFDYSHGVNYRVLRACFAIAGTEAGRDVVREGEAPAEPSLHRQVGSACEYPARQEPRPPEKESRPPENRKLLAVSKHAPRKDISAIVKTKRTVASLVA